MMGRFNARRYIATETAISVVINTVAGVAPAALSFSGQKAIPILSSHGLALGAAPQFFMGALMSALVPSLLTRLRRNKGKLGPDLDGDGPTVAKVMLVSLLMAAASALLGMALVGTVLPRLAGQGLRAGTMLLLNGAYGGLLAALVTPSALLLIFGRNWRRNHGQKRVGDRPGAVVDRFLGEALQRPSWTQRGDGSGRAGTR